MEKQDEVLLDLVNEKVVPLGDLLLLIQVGYLIPSVAACAKLEELRGAIHTLNPLVSS